jgi:hypothetical protein
MDSLISAPDDGKIDSATKRGRIQMILLLLVCAAPVIASYFTFYVVRPQGGKANIGELVSPVQTFPVKALDVDLRGKWTLLIARSATECKKGDDACVSLLYLMRQVRVAMGKESPRVQLVWLVTDDALISSEIENAYSGDLAGFKFIRMPKDPEKRKSIEEWLAKDNAASAIHLLDPYADRMMRFNTQQGVPEFKKVVKDLEKLLKWNPTGKVGA